jgi:hypothetical protein
VGTRVRAPEWLIVAGATVFILALAVSALFDADLRWLHVFQALMYVATITLSLRGSRWGYFIGISAAGLWDYTLFFASPLIAEFLKQPTRPDIVVQGLAWLGNLSVIIGCLWAYARLPARPRSDLGRFALAFVFTTGFLLAAVAVFQPQRLAVFAGMLHPHWPF